MWPGVRRTADGDNTHMDDTVLGDDIALDDPGGSGVTGNDVDTGSVRHEGEWGT